MKKQLLHRKVKNLGLVGFSFALYPHYNVSTLFGRTSFIGLNTTKPHPFPFLSASLSSLLISSFSRLGLLVCRPTTEFHNHCWEFLALKCISLKDNYDLSDVHSNIWIWSFIRNPLCFTLFWTNLLFFGGGCNTPEMACLCYCYKYISLLEELRNSK